MIVLFIVTILTYGFVLGSFMYCGVKIYRLPHLPPRWGFYLSTPHFALATYLLFVLITALFAARPSCVVLWVAIVRLVALFVLAGGISLPTLFFFGWINGAGSYAGKGNDDRTVDNNPRT